RSRSGRRGHRRRRAHAAAAAAERPVRMSAAAASVESASAAVPTIELRGVSRVYGSGATEVRALDNVDFTVESGEFVALMGPSGAGKSTCLNILGCLDRPTHGAYLFRGVDAAR